MDLTISAQQTFKGTPDLKKYVAPKSEIINTRQKTNSYDTVKYAGCIGWALLGLFLAGRIAFGAYKGIKNRIQSRRLQNTEVISNIQDTIKSN